MLGNIYSELSDFKLAYFYYAKGLKLNPNEFLILNGIGNVFHKQGRYKEAIKYYKSALESVPNQAGILNNLGKNS